MKILHDYVDFVELQLSHSSMLLDKSKLDLIKKNSFLFDKSTGYYFTRKKNGKKKYLHRLLLNEPKGKQVDHINQNKTDNRLRNLRVVDESVNKMNISGRKGSSLYRGVYWHKINNNWATNFTFKGKKYTCGSFQNEVDAAIAVDKKIDDLIGLVTLKNFPLERDGTIAYLGGTFDGLHHGHTQLFKNTLKVAEKIIISLNTDEFNIQYKKKKTIFSLDERKKMLEANKYIDSVVVNIGGSDSKPSILTVRPGYIIHGDDWFGDALMEQMSINRNFLSANDIHLVYMPYTKGISTTEIKRRIKDV